MIFNDENAPGFPIIVAMHINPTGGAEGPWAPWTGTLSVGDIEIGAVELKNHNTDDRVAVSATHELLTHNRKDMTSVANSAAGAIAMAVTPGVDAYIEQMTIHLSVAGGAACGDLTVTLDKNIGAPYNTVLLTQDMVAVVDYLWIPPRPIFIGALDGANVAWANNNGVTYGIEVYWSAH